MRNRKLIRSAVASVTTLGAATAALFAAAGPAAAAGPITDGSLVISTPLSVEETLVQHGIVEVPLPSARLGYDSTGQAVTETFQATGGTANLTTFTGEVDLDGKLLFTNLFKGECATFDAVTFDLFHDQIDATPEGSDTPVVLFDVSGRRHVSTDGNTQTFSSDAMVVDAAAASYLNSALRTDYFTAGQNLGSFTISWVRSAS